MNKYNDKKNIDRIECKSQTKAIDGKTEINQTHTQKRGKHWETDKNQR